MLEFKAFDSSGHCLKETKLYSIGGGFIVSQEMAEDSRIKKPVVSHPYNSAASSWKFVRVITWALQNSWWQMNVFGRTPQEVREGILALWQVMDESIERGCRREIDYYLAV